MKARREKKKAEKEDHCPNLLKKYKDEDVLSMGSAGGGPDPFDPVGQKQLLEAVKFLATFRNVSDTA